jgi:hypothetical protein
MVEAQKHDETSPLNGARVLVVEDDCLISMDLESTLAEAGAEIAGVCRTAKDALALLSRKGPPPPSWISGLAAKPSSQWPGNSPASAYPLSFIRGSWRPSPCCGPNGRGARSFASPPGPKQSSTRSLAW